MRALSKCMIMQYLDAEGTGCKIFTYGVASRQFVHVVSPAKAGTQLLIVSHKGRNPKALMSKIHCSIRGFK